MNRVHLGWFLALSAIVLLFLASGCQNPPAAKSGGAGGGRTGADSSSPPRGSAEERDATTIYALEVVDAKTVFAWATNDQGYVGSIVLKTSDGGAHWACVLRTDQTELVGLDFADATTGTAISDGGAVYSTTDGGKTWKASNDVGLLTQRYSLATNANDDESSGETGVNGIAFSGEKNGWAFGSREVAESGSKSAVATSTTRPTIWRTTDGGANWKETRVGADAPSLGLERGFFVDPQNGWIVGGNIEDDTTGAVLHTTDGGTTWKAVSPNPKQIPEDVFFVDTTHGWVVEATEDSNGNPGPSEVFRTEDGGATWKSLGKVAASLRAIRFADTQNGWVAGASGKIFVTADGGMTWSEQSAQDWAGGQLVDITDPQYPSGGAQPTFSRFVLVAPGHGWASADLGIYEYRAK